MPDIGKRMKLSNLVRALICLFFFSISFGTHAFEIQVYALFKDMAIIKVDGVQHKLKTGETTPEGVTLISADSEKAILQVKGKTESYPLGENFSISFAEKPKMEARIWSAGGMYLTNGFINDQVVKFVVDTGASWIAMNRQQADELGIQYLLIGDKAVASTANGHTSVHTVLLKKVRVGDIELHNVQAAVLENSNPKYILLGNSFLDRVDMEREGQMMLLKEK
jgi:aspartyl protease family protein